MSASRQDIKNLEGKFWATNMIIIPAKFQPCSSTGMGEKWDLHLTSPHFPMIPLQK